MTRRGVQVVERLAPSFTRCPNCGGQAALVIDGTRQSGGFFYRQPEDRVAFYQCRCGERFTARTVAPPCDGTCDHYDATAEQDKRMAANEDAENRRKRG